MRLAVQTRSLSAGAWSDGAGRSPLFGREARLLSLGHQRYQAVIHRAHGQQAGLSLFSEYHGCGELPAAQPDSGRSNFRHLQAAVGRTGPHGCANWCCKGLEHFAGQRRVVGAGGPLPALLPGNPGPGDLPPLLSRLLLPSFIVPCPYLLPSAGVSQFSAVPDSLPGKPDESETHRISLQTSSRGPSFQLSRPANLLARLPTRGESLHNLRRARFCRGHRVEGYGASGTDRS